MASEVLIDLPLNSLLTIRSATKEEPSKLVPVVLRKYSQEFLVTKYSCISAGEDTAVEEGLFNSVAGIIVEST